MLVVTVPILVHGLGTASYGVFVLASLVLGYAALLDLGLTPAVVRSIAMHGATSDRAAMSEIVGTAFTLFLALGTAGGLILFAITPLAVDRILHLPADLRGDAYFVLRLAAVGFACNLGLTLFTAIPQGVQRLDVYSKRTIFLTTLTGVAQIAAVKMGGGLRWVAIGTLAVNILGLLIFAVAARRLLPDVSFRPRLARWAVRQLGGFGAMKFVAQVAWLATFQLDRVIVAAFLPISQVTYYAIPVTITQKFTLVQASFSTAVFPAASELHAVNDMARMRALYRSAMKVMITIVLALAVIFTVDAGPIMSTWLGPSFGGESATILALLAVAYCLTLLTGIPALMADASGRPHWTAASIVATGVLNVPLTILLVSRLGAVGAAYALLVTNALQSFVFVWLVQRMVLKVPVMEVIRGVALRPAVAAAGLAAYALLTRPLIANFAELVIFTVIGAALYAALALFVGVLDARERTVVREMLQSGGSGLGRLLAPR